VNGQRKSVPVPSAPNSVTPPRHDLTARGIPSKIPPCTAIHSLHSHKSHADPSCMLLHHLSVPVNSPRCILDYAPYIRSRSLLSLNTYTTFAHHHQGKPKHSLPGSLSLVQDETLGYCSTRRRVGRLGSGTVSWYSRRQHSLYDRRCPDLHHILPGKLRPLSEHTCLEVSQSLTR
jgi:hypothetical protein